MKPIHTECLKHYGPVSYPYIWTFMGSSIAGGVMMGGFLGVFSPFICSYLYLSNDNKHHAILNFYNDLDKNLINGL